MIEAGELRGFVVRLLASASACLALIGAVALTAAPALGSSSTQPRISPDPLFIPGAFRLSASNGYTLYVIAIRPRGDRSGSLMIFAFKRGRSVQYVAPANVTDTSIQSDLGELGEISVSFHRTNKATSVPCGKETIRFDSGQWEGKIDFHGEEGYTSVEATAVPGNLDYFLSGLCDDGFFEINAGGRARGAALYVRNPGLGPQLSVSKKRPGAAALIIASTKEYRDGISIDRYMSLRMPGADFMYDRRLRTATVTPPAPFAGSARFDLGKKAGQRWSGNLTVDMPGKSGVPLTGSTLRAILVRSG